MRAKALLWAAMWAAACSPAFAANASYAVLVAKAQRGDTDTDYTALRLAYAASYAYDPYSANTRDLFAAAWAALQADDCATAMKKSDALLALDFTNIPVHAIREKCLAKAGDTAAAARELDAGKGLALSLLSSGDGKSVATAFVVVTLGEEEFVLVHFGIDEKKQLLIYDHGRPFDVIEGVDKSSGQKVDICFDVSNLFAGMSRKLKDAAPPDGGPQDGKPPSGDKQ
jgi:hypothetical protein